MATTVCATRSAIVATPSIRTPEPCGLGDHNRLDRGREVGPRALPIPDPVEVVPQIGLEPLEILAVHSRRALVGLDQPAASPHPHPRKQGPRRYYEPVRRRAPRRYSAPSGVRLGMLPRATLEARHPGRRSDARLLTLRARAADQAHAAFTPGTAWPVTGSPARLITRQQPDPSLSMPPRYVLTTPQQRTPASSPRAGRFLERLPGPHPTRSSAPSPRRSPRRSSTNTTQGGLAPSPERPRRRANKPPSPAQHRLSTMSLHDTSFNVHDTRPSHKRPTSPLDPF
jgi:hypothetical protein